MSKIAGKKCVIKKKGFDIRLVPMYHPAYALYQPSALIEMEKSFGKIKRELETG